MTSRTCFEWKINLNTNNEEYLGNQLLAQKLSQKGYDALIKNYVYIYPDDVIKTLTHIPLAWEALQGSGIDLGAGVGCISSTVALKKQVKKIYSLEVVESVVKLCQPIVIKNILAKKDRSKLISVIGEFDNLELDNASLEFAISWFSMHHSGDLIKTLKETRRVLKPKGKLIIIDRAHNNNTTDKEINRMLNIVYDEKFIKANFRPKGTILTRKENGEHEYRYREWESFITRAGFKITSQVVIKTDTPENRELKNDNYLSEVLLNFKLGVFKNRAVAYVLEK